MKNLTIFISYSWKNELEADKIENFFIAKGFAVKRDIREISYKRNIKEFMKTISDSDFVITLISDTFLKSHNCMYEILELTKNTDYKKKVMQVILNDAKIFKPVDRIEYLKYWADERSKLEEVMNSNINADAKTELNKDLNDYKNIEKTVYDFTSFIATENGISINELEKTSFKAILDYLSINYSAFKFPTQKKELQVKDLNSFRVGEQFMGKIKLFYNYGIFVQVITKDGYRDGLIHSSKLRAFNYRINSIKKLFAIGDDISIEICDINFTKKSSEFTGGLGFITTEQFENQVQDKIIHKIKNSLEDEFLDLSGLNLKTIPNEILKMTNLKQLMLTRNKFDDLPIILNSLKSLKTVFCDFKPKNPINYDYILYTSDED